MHTGNRFEALQDSPSTNNNSRSLDNRIKKDVQLRAQLSAALRKQNRLRPVPASKSLSPDESRLHTIAAKSSLQDAATVMAAHQNSNLLVLDESDQIVGVIGVREMLNALAEGVNVKKAQAGSMMHAMPPTVQFDDVSTMEAIRMMLESGTEILPMLDGDELIGVKEIDRLVNELPVPTDMLVADLLNETHEAATLIAVEPRVMVDELARMMNAEQCLCALVWDNHRMAGVCSVPDLILRVIACGLDASKTSLVRVMTPCPVLIPPEASIFQAISAIKENGGFVPVQNSSADGEIVAILDFSFIARQICHIENTLQQHHRPKRDDANTEEFNSSGDLLQNWHPPSVQFRDTDDDLSACAEYACDDDMITADVVMASMDALMVKDDTNIADEAAIKEGSVSDSKPPAAAADIVVAAKKKSRRVAPYVGMVILVGAAIGIGYLQRHRLASSLRFAK